MSQGETIKEEIRENKNIKSTYRDRRHHRMAGTLQNITKRAKSHSINFPNHIAIDSHMLLQ